MYFIISYNDHLSLLPYTVGMGEEMVIFAVSFSKEGIEKCLFQKMKPAFIKDETSFHQG
jgi:hypothetical protein